MAKQTMKRCKNCKQPFEQVHFLQKFCFKDECKKVWIESEKDKEWKKRKAEMKAKSQTRTELLKLAQITFNKWIRERDKNEPCISCQRTNILKKNSGHYYSQGAHSNVRFDEMNVHLQCEYCNTYLSGNLIPYGVNLEKKIGKIEFELLRNRAYEEKKWTIEEINQIIQKYKMK